MRCCLNPKLKFFKLKKIKSKFSHMRKLGGINIVSNSYFRENGGYSSFLKLPYAKYFGGYCLYSNVPTLRYFSYVVAILQRFGNRTLY